MEKDIEKAEEENERRRSLYDNVHQEFMEEIKCDPERCILIRCTVGPLVKDESVIFTIRSRLFTQAQIEVLFYISFSLFVVFGDDNLMPFDRITATVWTFRQSL